MAVSATNLIAGPASLWSGVFGVTEPLDTAVASAPGAGWADLGGTDDGVTLTVAREFYKLRMDQTIDAPGRRITERDISLSTNLAEGTLENLVLALAQTTAPATGGTGATAWKGMDIEGDDAGAEPTYTALLMDGKAPNGKRRRVIGRKMLSTEEVEVSYKKDEQTFFPVTFAAHWVSASIRPVRIVDSTAP